MYRAARFVAQLGFCAGARHRRRRCGCTRNGRRSSRSSGSAMNSGDCSSHAHPGAGINVLRKAGLLEYVLPELLPAIGVGTGWLPHPTTCSITQSRQWTPRPNDLVTRTAAILHDIGKPVTHALAPDGRHTFYDHAQVGADMARDILDPVALQQRRDQRGLPAGAPPPSFRSSTSVTLRQQGGPAVDRRLGANCGDSCSTSRRARHQRRPPIPPSRSSTSSRSAWTGSTRRRRLGDARSAHRRSADGARGARAGAGMGWAASKNRHPGDAVVEGNDRFPATPDGRHAPGSTRGPHGAPPDPVWR